MTRGLLLMLALVGCDEVFDLVEVERFDAAIDAPPDSALPAGLVAWFPMDSIANGILVDVTSNHEGSCTGDVCPQEVQGVIGNALLFNGTTQMINVPSSPLIDTKGSFTVSVWIRVNMRTSSDPFQCAVNKRYGVDELDTWQLCAADGTWYVYTTAPTFLTGPATRLDVWTHFAIGWDDATQNLTLFVDGFAEAQTALDINFDMGRVIFGADVDYGNPRAWTAGALDDVRIYNRLLSPQEILELASRD